MTDFDPRLDAGPTSGCLFAWRVAADAYIEAARCSLCRHRRFAPRAGSRCALDAALFGEK
jgi:hypothetical protein